MPALATPVQLGTYLHQTIAADDPTALLLLDIASGMVRDYLHAQVDEVVDDVVLLDPVADGSLLLLPELPVTAVSLVETFDGTVWSTADPATYSVSLRLGVVSALPWTGVTWPGGPSTWRVTYSHGFPAVPSSLEGVVLGVASRQYVTVDGVDAESLGGYSVKYATEAEGFTALELKALGRYLYPRIA